MDEKDYQKLMERMIRSLIILRFTEFSQTISETVKGEGFVLGYLLHTREAQPGDISQVAQASTAYVAKLLRGMEEKGLITRRRDEADKRRVLLTLTEKGQAEAARMEDEMRQEMIRFLKSLGDEDAQHLVRILSGIAEREEAKRK